MKTLWEKEKLLVTSNFSFSHSFLSVWTIFCHYYQIQNCRLRTQFGRVYKLLFRKRVKSKYSTIGHFCAWQRTILHQDWDKMDSASPLSHLLDKTDFKNPELCDVLLGVFHHENALNPFLLEHGEYFQMYGKHLKIDKAFACKEQLLLFASYLQSCLL